jgi:hypothetical protein
MKPETFIEAVGLIDDRFLNPEQPQRRIRHRKRNRMPAGFAAAAALILLPLPVMTAFGAETAYEILYRIAPPVAQSFHPAQMSCTDQGIEMTVISAKRSGSSADFYIAMHDLENKLPDGDWDLFDSEHINIRKDMTGTCSFSEYDSETHTAYFVTHLETMDGSPMPKRKVTFSVSSLLTGKNRTERVLDEIDLSTVPYEPETMQRPENQYCGASCYSGEVPDPVQYRFLVPSAEPLCTPAPGVNLCGIGYISGALHILTEYENNLETDNHGFISLHDSGGGQIGELSAVSFSFWDDTHTNHLEEQIIPVAYEALGDCSLYGEFVTAEPCLHGSWQVTFPLADEAVSPMN